MLDGDDDADDDDHVEGDDDGDDHVEGDDDGDVSIPKHVFPVIVP